MYDSEQVLSYFFLTDTHTCMRGCWAQRLL